MDRVRLTLAGLLACAVALTAASTRAQPSAPLLSDARVCEIFLYGGDAWNAETQECYPRRGAPVKASPGYACSVHYRTTGATRLRARILYDGRLQRSISKIVRGNGVESIGIAFGALRDTALPKGAYACEFTVGRARLRLPFAPPGPMQTVLAPTGCPTWLTYEHACTYDPTTPLDPLPSVTCSAVFARLQGHPVVIEIRREGELVYAGKDTLRYPITSEWARTAAPPGQLLPMGDYLCRFLVDGAVLAENGFTIGR